MITGVYMILIIDFDHIFGYRLLFYVLYQLDLKIHHGIIWESDTSITRWQRWSTTSGDEHGKWEMDGFPIKMITGVYMILIIDFDHIFGYRLLFYVIYQLDLKIHHGFIWETDTYITSWQRWSLAV